MNLETENEQLRTRLAEMAAEVERLQSVIDEANAQEPFGYSCGDWLFKEKGQFDSYSAAYMVGNKPEEKTAVAVYARPIPAQQCTHERIRETQTGDGVLFNGSHGHAGYVIEEQQSTAVTVPDFETWWRNLPSYRDADKPAAKMAWDYLAGKISGFQSPRITEQDDKTIPSESSKCSQRITEQDAREIAVAYALHRGTEYNKGYAEMFVDQFFATSEGRALLDKLNGDKNAR